MALVPQIADAVRIPVLAAGGTVDGQGITVAFALEASGVQPGTAFLGCPEPAVPPLYPAQLNTVSDDAPEVTPAFTGRPARAIRNRFVAEISGAEALKSGDIAAFGRLMTASHASSRDDFQNSSPALDALIEVAESSPGFLGGKLSGAGWAGCTVNLVEAGQAVGFAADVSEGYTKRTGLTPVVHVCRAAEGAWGGPKAL